MQSFRCVALSVIVATVSTFGQTAADGEITGRITDKQAFAIPGVRVTISSGTQRREAITDKDGRFTLGMLTLGAYQLTAEIAGFMPQSGTIALSPAIRRAHVEWPLEAGCLAEESRILFNAREAAPLVDTIAHIRVIAANGSVLFSRRPNCTGTVRQSYTVQVVHTVLQRSGQGDRPATRQIFLSRHEVLLSPGQEYVAMLWPELAGDGLVIPIVSGRISAPAGTALSGMRVEEALEALRKWAGEPRR